MLFTDESRFRFNNDFHCIIIWRECGTQFHPTNIMENRPFGGGCGGILLWAGIMFNGRTDLHHLRWWCCGCSEVQRRGSGITCATFQRCSWFTLYLYGHNARPHRAHLVDDYLEREDIQGMDWPIMSPDMNPIGHAWDALGGRVSACQPP